MTNGRAGRRLGLWILVTSALAACLPTVSVAQPESGKSVDVWIGTSRGGGSKGIYHCRLNLKTGQLSQPQLAAEISGPGFLAMHPKETHLYAVGSLDGKPCVAAYRIQRQASGPKLEFDSSVEIGDGGAAHVSVDSSGRTLLTAQYGGGSVAAFSLNDNGSLKEQTALIDHEGGAKVVTNRQNAPHAHWTGFSPDEKFAFVPDLGLDQVVIYKVDTTKASLTPHGTGVVPPGGGPRHMKFHKNGKWIYVLNELDLSVTLFDYDAEQGTMTPRQTIPSVPKEQLVKEKFKSASEIRMHPNGRFAYSANRGHDTITAYRINQDTGELTIIERENIRGATPRNFNIAPGGQWLLAAGQDSHTLASFEIDQETGELAYNRSNVSAPAPICVLFGHE